MLGQMSKIILIFGTTASGKSEFAVNLAKKVKGEIINADSMQIYKEIKILNTRPGKNLTSKIKHHLYGFHNVKNSFSVGQWLKLIKKIIKNILKKNKIPIVVGGTGLYFKALTDGLVKIPKIPKKLRLNIINQQNKIGQIKFYKKLVKLDPKCKNYINSKDSQRSIRAFEVKKFTGISLFDWFKNTKSQYDKNQLIKIYLDFPREIILKRIEARCKKIINKYSIYEVEKFNKLKVGKSLSSNKIIGIYEISDFLAKKYDLKHLREKISIKTRQYAKRQATWARGHMSDWTRVSEVETKNYIKNFKY
tara:strand:+ start:827 stop:1744 length:918 start_codon:yes stop_codon:yes gene_type:complete